MDDETRERAERDCKERDRATGLRSLLGGGLCQHCGSSDGTIVVWDDPEDLSDDAHTLEPCPLCGDNAMSQKTLFLELYKNCDPNQPITFTGSADGIVLSKLKTWMNGNNGENGKPCQVDGLTLTVHEEEVYEICLTWDEYYQTWELSWGIGEKTSGFDKWNRARNAFVDACSYEIWSG